jgi:serine protease Do
MARTRIFSVLALTLSVLGLAQQAQPGPEPKKNDALHEFSTSLESLARRVNRSVVKIVSVGYSLGSEDEESTNTAVLSRQRSLGTGVILSSDGYIVTNSHVVQGSRQVKVQLPATEQEVAGKHSILKPSGMMIDAKIVGVDRGTDLAVLKVEKTGLTHLSLGDSESLRPGQLVLAFGNPLGLLNSVSMGVVSSMARQIKPDDPMIYIQTDASINPGNSGGPLVDIDGRVMGINTFILSQSGGSEGIGFAIPSNIVRNVYDQIRKDGHVHRGQVGIHAQSLTPELASGLGLPRDDGVLVGDVTPDGPADESGVKVGDIILALDGKPMENARQFEVDLYRRTIGDKVTLTVLRDNHQLNLKVSVTEQEDDPQRFADLVDPEKNLIKQLGILAIELGPKTADLLPELRKPYGVLVAARIAAASGGRELQPGDVIHELNGTPVTSIAALRDAMDKRQPGSALVLQVERDGKLSYQTLDIE